MTNLVNKLGDQSEKVASKVIYCLTQLVFKHPMKQEIVLNEVEKLLFRPNISTKAQYYALCFLSQYYLSHENANVAKKLIEVYFAFFKACIKKVCYSIKKCLKEKEIQRLFIFFIFIRRLNVLINIIIINHRRV